MSGKHKTEDEKDIYRAEYIVNTRTRKNKTEYLIKWAGWSHKHNTWEPRSNILDPRLIDSYKKKKEKEKLRQQLYRNLYKNKKKDNDEKTSNHFDSDSSTSSEDDKQDEKDKQKIKLINNVLPLETNTKDQMTSVSLSKRSNEMNKSDFRTDISNNPTVDNEEERYKSSDSDFSTRSKINYDKTINDYDLETTNISNEKHSINTIDSSDPCATSSVVEDDRPTDDEEITEDNESTSDTITRSCDNLVINEIDNDKCSNDNFECEIEKFSEQQTQTPNEATLFTHEFKKLMNFSSNHLANQPIQKNLIERQSCNQSESKISSRKFFDKNNNHEDDQIYSNGKNSELSSFQDVHHSNYGTSHFQSATKASDLLKKRGSLLDTVVITDVTSPLNNTTITVRESKSKYFFKDTTKKCANNF